MCYLIIIELFYKLENFHRISYKARCKGYSMIISTIGSHSALQILYGAKEEGFKTRVYVIKGREDLVTVGIG